MMDAINLRLTSLITSLQSNPNITVTAAEIGPGTTTAEIDTARRYARGYLPPGVAEFYAQVGYFRLEWKYTGPPLPLTVDPEGDADLQFGYSQFLDWKAGAVNIVPIRDVFRSGKERTWYPTLADIMAGYTSDAEDEPTQNTNNNNANNNSWRYRFRHVKPFDNFIPEAAMAFVLDRGRPTDRVAFFYDGEALAKARWTFEEYLERLVVSRGFGYWHDMENEHLSIVSKVVFGGESEGVADGEAEG